MLVCALVSRYVIGEYQKEPRIAKNEYALPFGISASRVLGVVAGVAATTLHCNDKVSFLQAFTINMGAGCACLLPELLTCYYYGKDGRFPIQV